ncbi:MAG: hypothetical protein QG674_232 [Patescibacteria group bacterium]|nr:hypothetical protein [Patescibacteria group bacterium]
MINKVVILAVLSIIVLIVIIWLVDIYLLKTRLKIKALASKNIMLTIGGEREVLSYKKIAELFREWRKLNPKHSEEDFSSLATLRVISDINNMKRYEELRLYVKDYQEYISPFLSKIHQRVLKECNAHAGELFSKELSHIIALSNTNQKYRCLKDLVNELNSPSFEGFYFQKGNKQKAEKYLAQIEEDISSEQKGVISIKNTKTA